MTNTPELQLPSDELYRKKIDLLEARARALEGLNEALRNRLEQTLNDWREAQAKLQDIETSDILCDFIAEFYHSDLLNYMRQNYESLGLDSRPNSWAEISVKLCEEVRNNSKKTKLVCMQCAGLNEDEWNALYDFKRTRNIRVHPKRNRQVVRRVMKGLPNGLLKEALTKMFQKMVK